ncbi:hypothetical protein JY651_46110 [Pyxidicoccus parkwayensis]|uniref:GLTT repeat-containing protein n=1 Tax=Pyxidicoccus parkwayensis TaxID=2813578 RepID=A0ABX7NVI2_9BACT|nr:hypothetical protein [Pyxidicoccus parkwaysis]QSQ22416.1 hypothetical protein JY651_46110 [Pyxidicoccus parkwaysis]
MRSRHMQGLFAVVLLAAGVGCGPVEEPDAEEVGAVDSVEMEKQTGNGLSFNGLSFNGLSQNGLSFNGLSFNGLSSSGLSAAQFGTWFQSNPALADMVMRYIVRCAVPAGEVRSYTDPRKGRTYTWDGLLGLAPDWANGHQATTAEQQVVSACLAAHTNKRGISMAISVLGQNSRGQPIPSSFEELVDFPEQEACFFGNLFTGQGVYVGSDQGLLTGRRSSLRECALSPGPLQMEDNCPPMVPVGNCELTCDLRLLSPYYGYCYHNGIRYRALTTRMRSSDVFQCGDGKCQPTESCGLGVSYRDCLLDCGLCGG